MTAIPNTQKIDHITELGKKLRQAAATGRSAPLVVASEVVELCSHWDDYAEETAGLSASSWLKKVSGMSYAWWAKRAEAVQRLGESVRRTLDHEVACYVAGSIEPQHVDSVLFMLRQEFKANNDIPLTRAAAKHKINRLLKRRAEPHTCRSCAHLRELLAKHGITEE